MKTSDFFRSLALAVTAILTMGTAVQAGDTSSAELVDPAAPAAVEASTGHLEAAESPQGELRSLRIAGSVLRERNSADGTAVNTSGGCIYNSSGSAFGVLNTPVFLPQGTTVNTLRMYYNDTSASDSTGWFTIYDLYGTIVDEFSVSSSGSAGNSFNDSASINHVINYDLYSYVLNWRPAVAGTTMQLCGFRIFYGN